MLLIDVFYEREGRVPQSLDEIPALQDWREKKGDYSRYNDLTAFSYRPENYGTGRPVITAEYEEAGILYILTCDEKCNIERKEKVRP